MQAEDLRSDQDKALYTQLLEAREVQRLNEMIERREADGPMGTRRRLLSTSVRLTRAMAAPVHKTADECIERLGITIPVELYVYASPSYNAACVKPEDGRLFVMFSSSLLESFSGSEFRFVMGHELGHHLYGHHDIPIGYMMSAGSQIDPALALKLSAWSRYAEISADRAGAHCAKDFTGVARALFKLASGLSSNVVQFDLSAFLAQVDDLQTSHEEPGQSAPSADWFQTHPFSPLRVRALQLFHESVLAKSDGMPREQLEASVTELLGLMEPDYIEGTDDTAEAMRRLLFAGALVVADAHNNINEAEKAVFEKYFGRDSLNDRLDLDKIRAELPQRIEAVRQQASIGQRMQVMNDITKVACADGHSAPAELAVLRDIAHQLGLDASFVDTVSCPPGEPD
ncbi:M48 family metallopeptidase [Granulosicoccaceae sp. 1_MG-2023]|nr:M48 family metallopeptidase [Granulosicoccaceae sp. 1_MG-2023]